MTGKVTTPPSARKRSALLLANTNAFPFSITRPVESRHLFTSATWNVHLHLADQPSGDGPDRNSSVEPWFFKLCPLAVVKLSGASTGAKGVARPWLSNRW